MSVRVLGLNGRIPMVVCLTRAHQLIAQGKARRHTGRGDELRAIELTETLGHVRYERRASESSIVTTRKERYAGRTIIVHKHWDKSLEPLFRQAQTDCLTVSAARWEKMLKLHPSV